MIDVDVIEMFNNHFYAVLVAEGCLTNPAPPTTTTTTTIAPTIYKPTHVSGPFQDRHIMEEAEFESFHKWLTTDGQLTSADMTTLKNWRK